MTTTTITVPNVRHPERNRVAIAPVLKAGVVASLAGAIAAGVVELSARAASVPMRAADPGAKAAKTIPVGGFFTGTLMCCAVGIAIAVALTYLARRPARSFVAVTTVLAAGSLLGPVFAAHTTAATKVVLLLAHVAAAVVVIPLYARRLPAAGRRA